MKGTETGQQASKKILHLDSCKRAPLTKRQTEREWPKFDDLTGGQTLAGMEKREQPREGTEKGRRRTPAEGRKQGENEPSWSGKNLAAEERITEKGNTGSKYIAET